MEKKKAYIYVIGFFTIVAGFTLCYFLSYKSALTQYNKNALEKNTEIIYSAENQDVTPSVEVIEEDADLEDDELETVETDSGLTDVITPQTEFIMEEYDIDTNLLHEEVASLPEHLIGYNRIDLITYVNEYMLDMPLEDYQNGLSAYEIISFSPQKVVMRKTFNNDLVENKYFLVVYDGFVVVYYSDKKTVYEYTDINISNLPEDERIKLSNGFYVKDQEELYGVLENYSS